jgi:hypothetical protein
MPNRKTSAIGILALLGVLGAYTGYWFNAAGMLHEGIERWAEALRADGYEVAFGGIDITGYPFSLSATFAAPIIAAEPDKGAFRWSGPTARLEVRPWNLGRFALVVPGQHRIEHLWPGLPSPLLLTADEANVTGRLGWGVRADLYGLDMDGLRLAPEVGEAMVEARHLRASFSILRPTRWDYRTANLEITYELSSLRLPAVRDSPLGPVIERLSAQATLLGLLPPGPLHEAVAFWRDEGGTLEVRRFGLAWGPLEADAAGTLALDGEMRPLGALTGRIEGYDETLGALADSGALEAGEAAVAKVVLGLIARLPPEGGVPYLEVPLSVQEGRLHIGPLNLLPLPPIPWFLPPSE